MSEKIENLKEAFTEALKAAEGYSSDMGIPIFKCIDGTFEIGSAQHFQCSDISDGSFEEVARVEGWIYDYEDNGLSKKQQLDDLFLYCDWLDEHYQHFCEKYEL